MSAVGTAASAGFHRSGFIVKERAGTFISNVKGRSPPDFWVTGYKDQDCKILSRTLFLESPTHLSENNGRLKQVAGNAHRVSLLQKRRRQKHQSRFVKYY